MSRLFFRFPTVVRTALVYIALLSWFASARPISNAAAFSPILESGKFSQWHFFDSKYNHEVTLLVGSYNGNMGYVSRDFKSHCHEDGVWCVTHGDPQSLEMGIWYKGYNYQHNTVTADCNSKMPMFCRQYDNYIDPSVA
ncbi:hypothetical protein KI688_002598 [Linnemannia hyalina]|uniref:Uncharacterized protein n=1 Tax=Linnemannia hyalina TaxID=64524 RepID=A0A9P8BRC0_9FUNG|nr:hypothetical protein KI688_002598 [Linnemannia hyalina]